MKTSNFKIIVATLFLTIVVILLKVSHKKENEYIQQSEKSLSKRRLDITMANYTSICVLNSNVTLGFEEAFVGYANTFQGYLENITTYKSDENSRIQAILINKDNSQIAPLLVSLIAPYIIFGAFAVITIIAFITYWGCCCRPCWCCRSDAKGEGFCSWHGISLLMMILSLAGIIAVCIIGWIFGRQLPDKINAVECSFIRFYSDIKNGENTTSVPKWIGIDGVTQKFLDINNALTQVSTNSRNYNPNSNLQNTQSNYYGLLDAQYNNNKGLTITNPNPSTSTSSPTVTPAFIQTYGPKDTNLTVLNFIKLEYDINIYGGSILVNNFKTATNELNNNINSIQSGFTSASKTLEPLKNGTSSIYTDYISVVIDRVRLFSIIIFIFRKTTFLKELILHL